MLECTLMSSRLHTIISNFRGKKILVVGDIILDQYIKGSVSRISPEAPVPIVLQEGFPVYNPGGAANVANNLQSLGAQVTLAGRVGKDPEGKLLIKDLKKRKILTDGIFADKKIPTSLKTRIIAHHQQILRLDRELAVDFGDDELNRDLIHFVRKHIDSFDAIIISDYGKGVINSTLLSNVCTLVQQKKKIITVDPKVEHFSFYKGWTAITPNRKETENAIRNIKIIENAGKKFSVNTDRLRTDKDIQQAGQALLKYLDLESLLVTLGEEGMRLFERGKEPVHISTRAQEVYDVTGAGDTVISVFTLALSVGATKKEAADLANHAAGIVVQKVGAVAVTPKELLEALQELI